MSDTPTAARPARRRRRGSNDASSASTTAAAPSIESSARVDTPAKPARRKRRAEAPTPPVGPSVQASIATPEPAAPPAPVSLIRVPLAVRWRDLDAFNHVNNSKYLSFLEEARLQWMMTLPGMGLDDHVAPVVAAAQLNYRRPIEWPAQVVIELFVERLGTSSVTVGHRILAAGDGAPVLYCDGHVVMVWIDRGTGSAAPLPAAVRGACSPR